MMMPMMLMMITLIDDDDNDDVTTSCRLWLQLSGYSYATTAASSALSRLPMMAPPEETMESSLRADTLLYRVVVGALPDALSDKIRPGLIPYAEDKEEEDTAAAVRGGLYGRRRASSSAEDPPNRDSILQLALLRSAVLSKRLDDTTGCVEALLLHGANTTRPSPGVERVVKLCFGLALREGARSCLHPLL